MLIVRRSIFPNDASQVWSTIKINARHMNWECKKKKLIHCSQNLLAEASIHQDYFSCLHTLQVGDIVWILLLYAHISHHQTLFWSLIREQFNEPVDSTSTSVSFYQPYTTHLTSSSWICSGENYCLCPCVSHSAASFWLCGTLVYSVWETAVQLDGDRPKQNALCFSM